MGDIELVCSPVRGLDMFGEPTDATPAFDTALDLLIERGMLGPDMQIKRWGRKLKRCVAPELGGMVVELYIADRDNYGNLLVIRTGSKDFSARLMLPRQHGGHMPDHLRQTDGYLWNVRVSPWRKVCCPTEESYFAALGIREVPDPRHREKYDAYRLRSR